MDRRSRAQQWRRARHNYNDLCPPIGRRAATALLWLSCSIALLRALASSNARAQQRAAQRRSFLNAHHRSAAAAPAPAPAAAAAAQVHPESSESESDHEHEEVEVEPQLARPECLEFDQDDFETDSETESESNIVSETEIETELETEPETEPETAPTTEPETEPEDERGPQGATFNQSLTQRLHALKLQSDASPRRAQPTTQEPESASEGEEPQRGPLDQDPRDPEESEERQENRQPRRCKTRRPARRRDQSPESPPRKGPIPIRRH